MGSLTMRRADLRDLLTLPVPPQGYLLRTVRPDETATLAALMRLAFPEMAAEWDEAHVERELTADPNVARTFVIEAGDMVVATASALLEPEANPGVGVIHWVAVHPEHRGQRLGYLVSLAVLHEFVRQGCRSALLRTDPERLPAIKTYQNLGFILV